MLDKAAIVGGAGLLGCFTLILFVALIWAIRTTVCSLIVWLGWSVLVWTEVLTVEPSFWPVVGIGFVLNLLAGVFSGGGSSKSSD